ncbi:MAG: isoprenylcysteine carboxylmethyltransferase family protein [Anaerolineae bacterium]
MTTFIIIFISWALLHSLMAARRTKDWVRARIGERPYQGLYRLFYNLLAGVTFLPVLWITAVELPHRQLWNLSAPWSYAANLVQLIGLIGLGIALFQTDFWDFVGLRQAVRYISGEEEINLPPKLVTSGMYAFVRHPLYFFSLLVIWFTPLMTLQTLIFNFFATMYLWAGSRVEERRLADFFGPAYEEYRRKVPGLLPIKLTRLSLKS